MTKIKRHRLTDKDKAPIWAYISALPEKQNVDVALLTEEIRQRFSHEIAQSTVRDWCRYCGIKIKGGHYKNTGKLSSDRTRHLARIFQTFIKNLDAEQLLPEKDRIALAYYSKSISADEAMRKFHDIGIDVSLVDH